MKTRKIAALIVILALIIIPFAQATTFDQNTAATATSERLTQYYNGDKIPYNNIAAIAQGFNATFTGYLYNMSFYIKKEGSPVGGLTAALYGVGAGSWGTDAVPGGALAASDEYDLTGLGASYAWVDFNFTGNYGLVANTKYFAVLYVSDNSSGWVAVTEDIVASMSGSNSHGGNAAHFIGGSGGNSANWASLSTSYDYNFKVNGGTEASDYDLLPVDTDIDTSVNALLTFVVPVFIVLLPVFLLWFITRSMNKWILLIGLTIGVGLGYYYGFVPIWMVFLIAIGLVGLTYQSVKGGGAE